VSEDRDLRSIRAVLGGDREAFGDLVRRHQDGLFVFVGQLMPRGEDVDDLVQEAFLAAWRGLGSYAPERGRFSTWLFSIARNRCLDRLRARGGRRVDEGSAPAPEPVDPTSPADGLDRSERLAALDAALARLPDEQRVTLVLADLVGMPHAEIAALEQVEPGTVKSRVSRARARLRELLSPAPSSTFSDEVRS
jgi:RNA polymerase sigma-70 factor (ECF subfamily)